jgi:hypothetical protein
MVHRPAPKFLDGERKAPHHEWQLLVDTCDFLAYGAGRIFEPTR